MAGNDSNTETMNNDLTAPWRREIAIEASYEIEAMSKLVLSEVKRIDKAGDFDDELLALKGVIHRISQLNEIVMAAIDFPGETNESLRLRLG
jgi:hypothetical protein